MIIPALVCATLALAGCSSSGGNKPTAQPTSQPPTTSAPPTFDRNAALHEAWESARDTYPAELQLTICEAASKGGAPAVKGVLTDSDQMPFVVEHPDYDAGEWVKYCASK